MSETCSHGYMKKTRWDGYIWVPQHKAWCEKSPLPKPTKCEAEAKRGTGIGTCDKPLDQHGRCGYERNHITE